MAKQMSGIQPLRVNMPGSRHFAILPPPSSLAATVLPERQSPSRPRTIQIDLVLARNPLPFGLFVPLYLGNPLDPPKKGRRSVRSSHTLCFSTEPDAQTSRHPSFDLNSYSRFQDVHQDPCL